MKSLTKEDLRSTVEVISSIWNDRHTIKYIGKQGFICSFKYEYVDVSIKGKINTFHINELYIVEKFGNAKSK